MNSWSEFFHMGGYAWFVWGSYGVTLLLIVWETVMVLRKGKATMRILREEAAQAAEEITR